MAAYRTEHLPVDDGDDAGYIHGHHQTEAADGV